MTNACLTVSASIPSPANKWGITEDSICSLSDDYKIGNQTCVNPPLSNVPTLYKGINMKSKKYLVEYQKIKGSCLFIADFAENVIPSQCDMILPNEFLYKAGISDDGQFVYLITGIYSRKLYVSFNRGEGGWSEPAELREVAPYWGIDTYRASSISVSATKSLGDGSYQLLGTARGESKDVVNAFSVTFRPER